MVVFKKAFDYLERRTFFSLQLHKKRELTLKLMITIAFLNFE